MKVNLKIRKYKDLQNVLPHVSKSLKIRKEKVRTGTKTRIRLKQIKLIRYDK